MEHTDIHTRIEHHHQRYKAEAAQMGKDQAAQERPATKEEMSLCEREIRAKYQGMVRLVNATLLPETNRAASAVDTQLATQETADLDKAIAAKKHALNVHRMDNPQARGTISVPLKAVLVVLLTLVALGSESMWLSGAFTITGESSRLRATWIALGVTIIMGALAHTTVYAVRKLKRRSQKVATVLVSLSIAFVVYFILGTLRAKFLNEVLEDGEGLIVSAWMFAVLSLAVYVAIGAFSLFFFPSLVEIEEYRAHRKAKRELFRHALELKAIEAERKAMPGRFAKKMEARSSIVEAAEALKRTVCEMHRETYYHFVQTNVARRTTQPPAELFDEPHDLDLNDR